jgi:hypothetical protein
LTLQRLGAAPKSGVDQSAAAQQIAAPSVAVRPVVLAGALATFIHETQPLLDIAELLARGNESSRLARAACCGYPASSNLYIARFSRKQQKMLRERRRKEESFLSRLSIRTYSHAACNQVAEVLLSGGPLVAQAGEGL